MAEPRCQSTDVKYQYNQLNELERALKVLRLSGFLEDSLPFRQLYSLRGKLIAQLGLKLPRPTTLLKILVGLSPGIIKLWLDTESGWFSEARAKPGAPPIYHHVTDEVAMAIQKGELTHEQEAELMKPDDYIGE